MAVYVSLLQFSDQRANKPSQRAAVKLRIAEDVFEFKNIKISVLTGLYSHNDGSRAIDVDRPRVDRDDSSRSTDLIRVDRPSIVSSLFRESVT